MSFDLSWHVLTLNLAVSIPLEQGNVFRLIMARSNVKFGGLNPFGTGQCLSTKILRDIDQLWKSQSLWNRAMSFDR